MLKLNKLYSLKMCSLLYDNDTSTELFYKKHFKMRIFGVSFQGLFALSSSPCPLPALICSSVELTSTVYFSGFMAGGFQLGLINCLGLEGGRRGSPWYFSLSLAAAIASAFFYGSSSCQTNSPEFRVLLCGPVHW